MFATKRLKKKSQSVDISGPGCNPVAAEAQTPQPSKPSPATPTEPSEEEQNNTTNTQRRNPRRSDLKRFYTIACCFLRCKNIEETERVFPLLEVTFLVQNHRVWMKLEQDPSRLVQSMLLAPTEQGRELCLKALTAVTPKGWAMSMFPR